MIEQTEKKASNRTAIGKVVSTKMINTIIVEVERMVKHPFYGKYMKRFSRMPAHDQGNTCKMGDIVQIQQCRPLSKTKHWTLVDVVQRAEKSE